MSVIKGHNLTVGHKGHKIAEKVIKMPIMTFMSFIIAEKVTIISRSSVIHIKVTIVNDISFIKRSQLDHNVIHYC